MYLHVFTIEQRVTTNASTEYVYIINNKYWVDFLVKGCRSYRSGASDTDYVLMLIRNSVKCNSRKVSPKVHLRRLHGRGALNCINLISFGEELCIKPN